MLPVEAGVREAAALAEKLSAAAPRAPAKKADGSETPGKVQAAAEAAATAAAAAAKAAAAAAAASARLEPGQYASIADALSAAEAGDTVVLGPGHHWEVIKPLLYDRPLVVQAFCPWKHLCIHCVFPFV